MNIIMINGWIFGPCTANRYSINDQVYILVGAKTKEERDICLAIKNEINQSKSLGYAVIADRKDGNGMKVVASSVPKIDLSIVAHVMIRNNVTMLEISTNPSK